MKLEDYNKMLKPCPFCNEPVEIDEVEAPPGRTGFEIRCVSDACGNLSTTVFDRRRPLVDYWNNGYDDEPAAYLWTAVFDQAVLGGNCGRITIQLSTLYDSSYESDFIEMVENAYSGKVVRVESVEPLYRRERG